MSRLRARATIDRNVGAVLVLVAIFAPLIFNTYWIGTLLTDALILGILAATLIFLSAYGGMVSLAQVALYGIAAFAIGNLTTTGNTKGLNLGWSPLAAVPVAILVTLLMGLLFGVLARRSFGIYFLMITLTFGVIANLFFGEVTTVSGFGGISGIPTPTIIGNPAQHPARLYFVALVLALAVYALLRYLARTPFGLTLQGIRDDPVRMASLGYNVSLHRTLVFGAMSAVAGVGGILFAWWNGHVDPATINIGNSINVLIIAVIGGLSRLEGAWIGALVFVILNNYAQQISFVSSRFETLIGVIFLVIVLLSPDGLTGLWARAIDLLRTSRKQVPAADPGGGSPAN
ncbi:MAG: branched-chain amino acid ABC transporter permease [Actinomycetota bacterium]|nr:branched-chain amino acid ABC transporter permease [Actinomycetota bacterium]